MTENERLRAALTEIYRRTSLLLMQNAGRWDHKQEHQKRAVDVLVVNNSIAMDALHGQEQ